MKGRLLKTAPLAFCVLLAAIAYYYIGITDAGSVPVTVVPKPALTESAEALSPTQAFLARRERTRAQESAMLIALLAEDSISDGTRALAEECLLAITRATERELLLEGALAAMELDAVCAVRENAVVVMARQTLSAQQAARVLALAVEHTGVTPENIKIWE